MGKRHRWVGWTVGAIVAMSVVGALAIRFTPTHPFLDSIALLKNVRPKLVRESLSDLSQVGFKDPASSLPLVVSEEETFEIPRPFVEIDAELRSELRSAPSSTLTDSGLAMYSFGTKPVDRKYVQVVKNGPQQTTIYVHELRRATWLDRARLWINRKLGRTKTDNPTVIFCSG